MPKPRREKEAPVPTPEQFAEEGRRIRAANEAARLQREAQHRCGNCVRCKARPVANDNAAKVKP